MTSMPRPPFPASPLANGAFPWPRARQATTLVAVGGSLLAALGGWLDPSAFFAAYLWSFRLWLGCGAGALAVLMIHHLVGGGWGGVTRRPLEAGALTLPWLALLFVPLCFGLPTLFPWARPGAGADAILQHRVLYLNTPFFLVRALLYFGLWSGFAFWLARLSDQQDLANDPALVTRLTAVSAGGLVAFTLTSFFAAIDWGMAMEAHWFSTAYGLILDAGWIITGFALANFTVMLLRQRTPFVEVLKPQHFNDLGNLLLASVMSWAYVSYSQLIVIWSGNLPADNSWYVHRSAGGWGWVAGAVALVAFALPFFALLSRGLKRQPVALAAIAAVAFLGQALFNFWEVVPGLRPVVSLHWLDISLPITLGAWWLRAYLVILARRPLLPRYGEPIRETPDHAYHTT